jgi:hypothetical protein
MSSYTILFTVSSKSTEIKKIDFGFSIKIDDLTSWFRIVSAIGPGERSAGRLRAFLRQEQNTDEISPANQRRKIPGLRVIESRTSPNRYCRVSRTLCLNDKP